MDSKSHFLVHFIPGILTGAVVGLAFGSLFVLFANEPEQDIVIDSTVGVDASVGPTDVDEPSKLEIPSFEGVKESECDEPTENCLYQIGDAYYPAGLATLKGYYEKYSSEGWDGRAVTCDGFVVTDGPDLLLNGFEKLIAAGSGVVTKVSGGLRMAISKNDVTENEYNDIRRSTPQSQISLQGFVTQPIDGGVETCYEPMRILNLE